MSDIYNCKEDSWISQTSRKCCFKDDSDSEQCMNCQCEKGSDNKWSKVVVTMKELVEHEYFDDVSSHCQGIVGITRTSSGFEVDLDKVTCK